MTSFQRILLLSPTQESLTVKLNIRIAPTRIHAGVSIKGSVHLVQRVDSSTVVRIVIKWGMQYPVVGRRKIGNPKIRTVAPLGIE